MWRCHSAVVRKVGGLLFIMAPWTEKMNANGPKFKTNQLVVMGSLKDITKRGKYAHGKVLELISQIRKGKPLV